MSGPSGQLAQFTYGYDDARNVVMQTDQYGSHQFAYDGLNRLTQTTRAVSAGLPNESYTYDRVGNREQPGNAASYAYDSNNRITASPGRTYAFDADGNTITRSDGATLSYDPGNRLVTFSQAATTAQYLYDSSGRRLRKSINGVHRWFLWDGTSLLGEYDASGARLKRYSYLENDALPIQVQDAAGTYYVQSDHLQTPRLLTGASGAIVWRSRQEAFGATLVEQDVDGNGVAIVFNQRLPGQYYDSESGLHYNYFRDYDPQIGRYVQSDPIGIKGGNNTYAYTTNNPLTWADLLGLDSGPPICSGRDCVNPPYDPTPDGPKPSPQPRTPPAGKAPPDAPRYDMCPKGPLKKPCKWCVDYACNYAPAYCCDIDNKGCLAGREDDPTAIVECNGRFTACMFRAGK